MYVLLCYEMHLGYISIQVKVSIVYNVTIDETVFAFYFILFLIRFQPSRALEYRWPFICWYN